MLCPSYLSPSEEPADCLHHAFSLFIARLVIDYSKSNPLSVILEVALLILLAVVAAKVLKNFIAKRPVDTQVSDSPLYWALGLQVFLTLVTWAVPADGPDIVVLVLGIALTLLSALPARPSLDLYCNSPGHPRPGNFAQRSEPADLADHFYSAHCWRYLAPAGATEQAGCSSSAPGS